MVAEPFLMSGAARFLTDTRLEHWAAVVDTPPPEVPVVSFPFDEVCVTRPEVVRPERNE